MATHPRKRMSIRPRLVVFHGCSRHKPYFNLLCSHQHSSRNGFLFDGSLYGLQGRYRIRLHLQFLNSCNYRMPGSNPECPSIQRGMGSGSLSVHRRRGSGWRTRSVDHDYGSAVKAWLFVILACAQSLAQFAVSDINTFHTDSHVINCTENHQGISDPGWEYNCDFGSGNCTGSAGPVCGNIPTNTVSTAGTCPVPPDGQARELQVSWTGALDGGVNFHPSINSTATATLIPPTMTGRGRCGFATPT